MTNFFFYGTLCHRPLLERVLGRPVTLHPAQFADHAVHWAEGHSFPMIVPRPGAVAEGMLAEGMAKEDIARLAFYEGGFAYHAHEVTVVADGARVPAQVFFPDPGQWQPGAPWQLGDWAARWGAVVTEAAADFMAAYGKRSPEEVLARYDSLLIRAASRLRAQATPRPATLRHHCRPGDIRVIARHEPYARFFAVEEYEMTHRRFDGAEGPQMNRAVFISADAATVLPYDPARDRVMLVEQFRAGPLARGDLEPWLLEPIAGRVDPGETPEEAMHREAIEEAGLKLGQLLHVADYYPTPGAKSEYIYSYIGLADLPDSAAGIGGMADEQEDIRGHVIGFERLMALIASGEVVNAPLILSAFWLQRERPRLRARARGAALAPRAPL